MSGMFKTSSKCPECDSFVNCTFEGDSGDVAYVCSGCGIEVDSPQGLVTDGDFEDEVLFE